MIASANNTKKTNENPVLNEGSNEKSGKKNTYRSLIRLVRSFPIGVGSGVFVAILLFSDVASQLASPLLTQALVDGIASGESVGILIALLTGVMVAGTLFEGLMYYLVAKMGSQWVLKIRNEVTKKLLLAPVSFFDKERSSAPASHLIKDTSLIQELISQQAIGVISGLIVVVGCVVVMGMLDVVLTAVLLGIVLAAFLITLPIAAGLTVLSQKLQQHEAESIASMGELLGEIDLVKSMTAEHSLIERQQNRMRRLFGFELKEIRIQSLLGPLAGIAISAGMIAILAFGSYRVSMGAISIGKLLAFILYLFNIVIPLASLSVFIGSLNKAAGAADQLVAFLDAPQEPLEGGELVELDGHDIHCNHLDFSFGPHSILKEIDLKIPAGQTTALVGESGAGKTTLLKLLDRLYSVEPGQLCVGDIGVESVSLRAWRKQVAVVSQSAPAIAGSLRDNLTLGLESPVDDARLMDLISNLGLNDLVFEPDESNDETRNNELRQLLDGELREGGKNLSGGQKQRLAIIRAILRQPKLLLLDEATSALDSLNEQKVTAALRDLAKDTTVVVAAHRLSTVINADQIVVMKDGKVIDSGQHEQLFSRCDYYQELVQQQMVVAEA